MIRLLVTAVIATAAATASAQPREIGHPFLLWTPEEAAAIRERIANDPEAKKQLEATVSFRGNKGGTPTILNLFKAQVLQDEQAAERQKGELLKFIGRKPEPMTWDDVDLETFEWNEGMPSRGDRHMRDEQTENVLRYDIFYDQLNPQQIKGIEQSFKDYIKFHLMGHPPRHPHFDYDRTSWLPNMHWPRPIGTHVMAVAMQDEKLIKDMFEGNGGWKWYFDEYLTDKGFYMEEFGKFYSNVGTMFLWCDGLEKLGLSQYGYGYTGTNGATMKGMMEANTIDVTYPMTDWGPGGVPSFGKVTMGDAKGHGIGGAPIQHATVAGYLPNGRGGHNWASNSHMNGPMHKVREPVWFEASHAQWPDEGWDYFMYALREPGETTYYPTLLYNLKPITSKPTPPTPEPSFAAKQRGFGFLKAEHSNEYWESWKPAVSLQFARYYVHYVHDSFSLLGYHAYNAPIYLNGGGSGGGYAGGNAWKDSVRGHSGVIVDNLQAQPAARLFDGTVGHSYREALDYDRNVRFLAVRAAGVYPDVDMERGLLLTDDYLFDVFWLDSSAGQRTYDWQVQSPATAKLTDGWQATDELDGGVLYKGSKFERKAANGKQDLTNVHKHEPAEGDWHAHLQFSATTDDVTKSPIAHFTNRGIGVRVHLLGEPGTKTIAYAGSPPGFKAAPDNPTTLIARRQAEDTTFVALHDHFDNGKPRVDKFQRIAGNDRGMFVRITGANGAAINDRIAMAVGDGAADQPITLQGDGESITFTDHAWVRIDGNQVEALGNISALSVKLPEIIGVIGSPALHLNGKKVDAKVTNNVMTYQK